MDKRFEEMRLHQTDDLIRTWRRAKLTPRPRGGWIRTIREALGMSAVALGRRLGILNSSVLKLEQAEADDSITLGTLRKVAAALDCELQYALVPRRSLDDMIKDRAVQLAKEQLGPVEHTMPLEDQAVADKARKRQLKLLIRELLDGPRRNFW